MIDAAAVFRQLALCQQGLFGDYQKYIQTIQNFWLCAIRDDRLFQKTRIEVRQPVVSWREPIAQHSVVLPFSSYQTIAVDGSQIYPDRHDDISVSLINVGGIWLFYTSSARVAFFSTPTTFFQPEEHVAQSVSMVDAQRHLLELETGLEKALFYQFVQSKQSLLLFDGTLICWHLENDKKLFARYFDQVCAVLNRLYEENIIVAWYTSRPKSRDLVRLLSAYVTSERQDASCFCRYSDSDVINTWLGVHERTTVFACAGEFVNHYPVYARPYFFYINSGVEIARVEIPAYIAQQPELVECVASMVIDQCIKGDGYPVALAEAHEQVVIKKPDRQVFRVLVNHFAQRHATVLTPSRKLMKKQSLGL